MEPLRLAVHAGHVPLLLGKDDRHVLSAPNVAVPPEVGTEDVALQVLGELDKIVQVVRGRANETRDGPDKWRNAAHVDVDVAPTIADDDGSSRAAARRESARRSEMALDISNEETAS